MPVEKNPYDDEDKAWERVNQEDPWVLYLVVRKSLNMGAGKIASQCGHVVGMIYEKYMILDSLDRGGDLTSENDAHSLLDFDSWRQESYRKVALEADDKNWEKLKNELPVFVVKDAGLTSVAPGSETAIGLWPMKKSDAPKLIKRLQVLK